MNNLEKNGGDVIVKSQKYRNQYIKEPVKHVLSSYQEQVLLGSMLGDGGVYRQRTTGNYEYRELHGLDQLEYLQWKCSVFASLGATIKIYEKNCLLRIAPNVLFTEYRNMFYDDKSKKLIIPSALDKLTALGLAVWFMDNGSGNEDRLGIAYNYTQPDAKRHIADYFLTKFNMPVKVTPNEVNFNKEDSIKLAKMFLQHIHPSLYYKIGNILRTLPDIHLQKPPVADILINRVGVEGVEFPLMVERKGDGIQEVLSSFNMFASLPANFRGTNMSRFTETLLEMHTSSPLGGRNFLKFLRKLQHKIVSNDVYASAKFKYFFTKKAPATGKSQFMTCDCKFIGLLGVNPQKVGRRILQNEKYKFILEVTLPVSIYCPCSKAMCVVDEALDAGYGAHAQRCIVTLQVATDPPQPGIWIEDMISIIESSGSAELYTLLKRADEQFATAHGYGNPKFTEDAARDVIAKAQLLPNAVWIRVKTEAQESIHPYQAVSYIGMRKEAGIWLSDPRGFY